MSEKVCPECGYEGYEENICPDCGGEMISKEGGGCGCGCIGLIIFLVIIGLIFKIGPFEKDYSKPWWTGTQTMRVCQVFGNENCYALSVSSNGEFITQISFPNGGYITAYDSECAKAADFYDFDRFCSVWDSEDRQWDIIPY